jgi:hypothetical protein
MEDARGTAVARVVVADDAQEVSEVDIFPFAVTLRYPETSESEAIKLALADPEVREELTRHGPYTTDAEYSEADGEWTVHVEVDEEGSVGGYPVENGEGKEIARVGVDDATWELNYVWTGDQVGWRMARGDYGAYGKQANYTYVWAPLALIFALAFWRTDKLFSLRNLDVLALLGFLVSHGFFRAGETYPAVLLWYPPLLYLLVRTLLMGFGIGERIEKTSNFPTGSFSARGSGKRPGPRAKPRLAGDRRWLRGRRRGRPHHRRETPLREHARLRGYGRHLRSFELPGLRALSVALRMVRGVGLSAGGSRGYGLRVRRRGAGYARPGLRYAGPRGAAAMFFAWAVFPYTLYSTNNNTNDMIVAAVMAVGLATAASPLARGASIAAGFAIKLFPLVLAPLWLLHDGPKKRSHVLDFVLGGASIMLLTFWVLALEVNPVEGLRIFYEHTIAFQGERETPWSIFAQVPELRVLQQPLTWLTGLLAVVVAVLPRGGASEGWQHSRRPSSSPLS